MGFLFGLRTRPKPVDLGLIIAGLAMVLLLPAQPGPVGPAPSAPGPAGALKAMSFNIHHGRSLDGRSNLDRVAELIDQTGAGLVGLQEVDVRLPRTGFEDQAAILAEKTGLKYVFIPSIGTKGIGYGNALLSRYPIASAVKLPMPGFGEPRSALIAKVHLPGDRPVLAVVTHFGLNKAERLRQAGILAGRLEDEALPIILLGDLNAGPSSRETATVRGDLLTDAHAGNTEPTISELGRIDYVLISRHWSARSAWVPEGGGSDHRPVVAEIKAEIEIEGWP